MPTLDAVLLEESALVTDFGHPPTTSPGRSHHKHSSTYVRVLGQRSAIFEIHVGLRCLSRSLGSDADVLKAQTDGRLTLGRLHSKPWD